MRRTIELFISTVLVLYFISLGGTFNAVLMPDLQRFSLILLSLTVGIWWAARWRGRWASHQTAFDWLVPLWGAVFVLSIAANPETWRRSAEALWYMLLYVLVWYTLADALANGMDRRLWLNAVLLVGVVQIPLVLIQVVYYYANGGSGLVRPIGSISNPNLLGALCIVLLPLALANWLDAKSRLLRRAYGAFLVVVVLMLAITFSRGAWLGTGAMALTFGLFWLRMQGVDSLAAARGRWQELPRRQQRLILGAGLGLFAVLAGLFVFLLASLNIAGRGAEYRTGLWECAWQMFAQQPLIGQGIFTYGYHQAPCQSIPPQQPHSHPHSLPLLVLAELGLVGGVIGAATIVAGFRAAHAQGCQLPQWFRWTFAALVSALVGMGVQNIVDGTVTHPFMMLLVLVLAAAALVPMQPIPLTSAWRRAVHAWGILVLWVVLLAVGFWQSGIMRQYSAVLADAVREGRPALMAERLQPIIDQDPYNAAYRRQQAYLLGLAAHRDADLLPRAIAAYERLNQMEPNYAADFLNHAALRWQAGQREEAAALAERAAALASDWVLARDLLAYYRGEAPSPPKRVESIYAPATVYFQMLRYIIVEELLPQIEEAAP